jgi:hypothetical protein
VVEAAHVAAGAVLLEQQRLQLREHDHFGEGMKEKEKEEAKEEDTREHGYAQNTRTA